MQLKTLPRGTSWTRSGSTPAIFCARAAGAAFPWGFITSSRNQWVSQSFSAAWGETERSLHDIKASTHRRYSRPTRLIRSHPSLPDHKTSFCIFLQPRPGVTKRLWKTWRIQTLEDFNCVRSKRCKSCRICHTSETAYVTMSALLLERLNKKTYMSEKHLKFKSNFIPGYTIRSCTILRVFL